jgi:hypothetical protein
MAPRVRKREPDWGRAKRVILELLRQAGGELGKTKLFKAFWLAHLYYFKKASGYLTDWPIVRMPNGPGIDKAGSLLGELRVKGKVVINHESRGPFTEICCRIIGEPPQGDLSEAAVSAIKEAVEFVKPLTTEQLSDLSHEFSRSWNYKSNGEELDIYTDLIPDDEYEEGWKELAQIKKDYEDIFQ